MQLSVTGKRLNVGDALRGHIEKTLAASVTIYFENATDSQVTLSKDGQKLRADITAHAGKRMVIQRHAVTGDPYAAFEGATDIDSKRSRRYKRSLRDNHKRHTKYESSERAQQHFSRCRGAKRNRTLSVGEAAMRMDRRELTTMMFRKRTHGGLNTVYRREDGNIGWIDLHNSPDTDRKT